MSRILVITLAALSSFAAAPLVPASNYSVTRISISAGTALNNYGQVAGTSGTSVFLWTPSTPNGNAGTLVDIGVQLAQFFSTIAMNDYGQVVGTAVFPSNAQQAFVWSPDVPNGSNGMATAFLLPDSVESSSASAINAIGKSRAVMGETVISGCPQQAMERLER
jgi:hypothetical protein